MRLSSRDRWLRASLLLLASSFFVSIVLIFAQGSVDNTESSSPSWNDDDSSVTASMAPDLPDVTTRKTASSSEPLSYAEFDDNIKDEIASHGQGHQGNRNYGTIDQRVIERLRESAMDRNVRMYSLLFEHLGLSEAERRDLLGLFVDNQIASASIGTANAFREGVEISPEQRLAQIEDIIGPAKLEEFLELEESLRAYYDLDRINSNLEAHGVPLSVSQRDGLFDLLVAIDAAYEVPMPMRSDSIDEIDVVNAKVAQLDDQVRLLLEQLPSVLSPTQVQYVYEQQSTIHYRRMENLKMQQMSRETDSSYDVPPYYLGQ